MPVIGQSAFDLCIFLLVLSIPASPTALTFPGAAGRGGFNIYPFMSKPNQFALWWVIATWFLLSVAAVPGYLPPIFFSEADLADEDRFIRFFLLNDARQFTAMLISGVLVVENPIETQV
jgi:hypothetical protein